MTKQTMGMMILSLRKEKGMTQAQLAEKMNVTDKAVSKWERDLSYPDINTIPKLAEIFNISVDELMQTKKNETSSLKEKINEITGIVLKALTLAMGVSVVVLTSIKDASLNSCVKLLGIGLTCAGISFFHNQKK